MAGELVRSNDNETWALTYKEANYIPAFEPAKGPRFVFRNVTLWSGPSYLGALPIIEKAIAEAARGSAWKDSRTDQSPSPAQESKAKHPFMEAIERPWMVAILLGGVFIILLGAPSFPSAATLIGSQGNVIPATHANI